MSYQGAPPYVTSLLREVEDLRREVSVLNEKVDLVLSLLKSDRDSIGRFELFEGDSQGPRESNQPAVASSSLQSGTSAPVGTQSWEEREKISREVGAYLVRALAGQHRGSSGRDKIKLGSRLYIIVRDFVGNVHVSPVRVLYRFSEVKQACCRGGDWGDSIFVGFPSQREGRVCIASAGFAWPESD